MNRKAPNNQLPATHFIEVWKGGSVKVYQNDIIPIKHIKTYLNATKYLCFKTIAIFKIRENKVPTLHKFKP